MSSASDLTSVAYIYKKTYAVGLGDAALREHPLLNNATKIGAFTGESFRYSVKYGNPQGVGGTLPKAQANAQSSKGLQFEAFRFTKYGVVTLKGEAIAASEGNNGSLIDLVTNETEAILSEMVDSLAFDLYRGATSGGTGIRGQRKSASTNIITLVVADDARNFKVGMTVGASPNLDASSPRTGTTTIAGVDEDLGSVTLTSAAAISGFADNDYLYRDGDPGTCVEGWEACTPLTAPAPAESFRSKDRSVDARRLAGSRLSDTTNTIEENGGTVAIRINQAGGKANQYYLNPQNFWQVARRANAKVVYEGAGGNVDYGFETMMLHTPAGTMKVFSDPDCPTNRGRLVNSADWYIRHLKDFPHVIMDDGRPNLRQTSDDGIEARMRSFHNLIQPNTRNHGVHLI